MASEAGYERYPKWMQAEGFRGSAVVPLIAEGHAVGALTVSHRRPRLLDAGELRLLQLMGNQAAMAIDTARLHQEEVRVLALARELELGREIQLSLLPRGTPMLPGWEFATHYEPANEVGGDFYDFFDLTGSGIDPPGRGLGIVIADVVGKGVAAALFMALSRTLIRSSALEVGEPVAAMLRANDLIRRDNQTGEFLTALYASLDPATGRMIYVNAGHNPPLWLRAATGQVQELTEHGIVLGIVDQVGLQACPIKLAPGDCVIFYTDGVTEAMNADHQLFGDEALRDVVAAHAGSSAQEIVRAIVRAVQAFSGGTPASDDLTLFVVRRLPTNETAPSQPKAARNT
jgi:sigma-B regulation protein RsbU (phosphoserine phosphatase)